MARKVSLVLGVVVLAALVSPLLGAGTATTLKDAAAQSGRYFGTCAPVNKISDGAWQNLAKREFNVLTCENEMKLDATEPSQGRFDFGNADRIKSWASSNGMKMRGHTLAWHSQQPSWMSNMNGATLRSAMISHIKGVLAHYKGDKQFVAWDVVNEAFADSPNWGKRRQSNLQGTGDDWIEVAFKTAHEADPDAKLCYNDYDTDSMTHEKTKGVYNMLKDFVARGVPVHCVGFQAHINPNSPLPADYQANLQQFADLGLDVQLTELDIEGAAQAKFEQAVKACMNTQSCTGISVWGIRDSESWRSSASPLLFDGSGNKKAAYTGALAGANDVSVPYVPYWGKKPTTTPVDVCKTNNGGCDASHGVCSGNGTCACATGYTGDGKTCTAVVAANACQTSNGGCDANAACTLNAGAASCKCKDGFTGDGKSCTKTVVETGNACKTNNGGCDIDNGVCSLSAGAAVCKCATGYSTTDKGKTCTKDDVVDPPVGTNECDTDNGGCDAEHATCSISTTTKTVKCTCETGYTLNSDKKTCKAPVDVVTVNLCLTNNGGCDEENGICKISASAVACSCKSGYKLGTNKKLCTEITTTDPVNGAAANSGTSSETTIAIIVAVVVAIVLIGLGVYFFFLRPKANFQTNTDKMGYSTNTGYGQQPYGQPRPPPPQQGYYA